MISIGFCTVAAEFFRFVVRKIPLVNSLALHRAYSRSPQYIRYLGAATDALPRTLMSSGVEEPQALASFVANISPGAISEGDKRVSFVVTSVNVGLFLDEPSNATIRTLTFTVAGDV